MMFSTTSSQQATPPSHTSILRTNYFRQVTSKILQKMKNLSKAKGDLTLENPSSAEIQVARFVTFTRPTGAPQIIDLKALKRNIPPRKNVPELRVQTSLKTVRSSTEMATPLLSDAQQVPVLDASDEFAGYELLDDKDSDVDWTLLDLPEAVYGRLANESRHSLI